MGVGYQVSPLHRLIRMDMTQVHARPVVRGESPLLDAITAASGGEVRFPQLLLGASFWLPFSPRTDA